MKRLMAKKQEQVYRLRHHDFEGLSTKETAERLKISESSVYRILHGLKKKFPQLFPILNPRQAAIHLYITDCGFTHSEIADIMNISVKTVDRIVEQMRIKEVNFAKPPKTVQYQEYMDSKIKRVF